MNGVGFLCFAQLNVENLVIFVDNQSFLWITFV